MSAALRSPTKPRAPRRRAAAVFALGLGLAAQIIVAAACGAELPPPSARPIDFRRDVYPLLSERCFKCHSGSDPKAGVRLDDRQEILGETTGIALAHAGRSADSRLIQLVAGADPDKPMPPKGKPLTTAEVGVLRAWIDQGLAWDDQLLPPVATRTTHWAFQSVKRPGVPAASLATTTRDRSPALPARNPVDHFIRAQLAAKGLAPAPEADRRTLIRRLALDLTGLPPTLEESERFVRDAAPRAYEDLVERLLASPHYGERWARHWLDVARWAESEGYESNHPRPFAWRYRDWVIRSFNADLPFDQFLRQQLAGDELTPHTDDSVIATGFLAAARINSNEEDMWLQRNQMLVDVVNATGSAFLGLTLNCAQCHNHKFDPISAGDYYRLLAFFAPGQPVNVALRDPALRGDYEAKLPPEYAAARQLKDVLFATGRAAFIAEARKRMTPEMLRAVDAPSDRRTLEQERLARLADLQFQSTPGGYEARIPAENKPLYTETKKKIEAIEKQLIEPQTFAFHSPVTSANALRVLPSIGFYPLPYDPAEFARSRTYLHVRGDVHQIGPTLGPGWPAVFEQALPRPAPSSRVGARTALADWLTDPRHPLTARVWVNRLWQHHFGRGLVATAGDFGVKGAVPTHPELLDWLASELVASGWSTKRIHRLIVTSATYRQRSAVEGAKSEKVETTLGGSGSSTAARQPSKAANIDPENHLLARFPTRRLEAEALRDAMLATTGELDRTLGGASVPLANGDETTRRSLYIFQRRGAPPELQRNFDGPNESAESCERRHVSTTALQSLYLLNNAFVLHRARALARVVALDAPEGNERRQVDAAFLRVLGRVPAAAERLAALTLLARSAAGAAGAAGVGAEISPLVHLCHALLNLNEFAYLE